jgi:hypothetical protein
MRVLVPDASAILYAIAGKLRAALSTGGAGSFGRDILYIHVEITSAVPLFLLSPSKPLLSGFLSAALASRVHFPQGAADSLLWSCVLRVYRVGFNEKRRFQLLMVVVQAEWFVHAMGE